MTSKQQECGRIRCVMDTIRMACVLYRFRRYKDEHRPRPSHFGYKDEAKNEEAFIRHLLKNTSCCGGIRNRIILLFHLPKWSGFKKRQKKQEDKIKKALKEAKLPRQRQGRSEPYPYIKHSEYEEDVRVDNPNYGGMSGAGVNARVDFASFVIKTFNRISNDYIEITHQGTTFLTPSGFADEMKASSNALLFFLTPLLGGGAIVLFFKEAGLFLCTNISQIASICARIYTL